MAKSKLNKTTKMIFVLIVFAMIFAFFYGTQGNTAKFIAASQTRTSYGMVGMPPVQLSTPTPIVKGTTPDISVRLSTEELYESVTKIAASSAKVINVHANGGTRKGLYITSKGIETDDVYFWITSTDCKMYFKDHDNANKIIYFGKCGTASGKATQPWDVTYA